jgi:hypothetical protein
MALKLNKNASVKFQPTTTQGFQSITTRIINANLSDASKPLSKKGQMALLASDGFEEIK